MKRVLISLLPFMFLILIGNAEAANAKAGFKFDYANSTALSSFNFEESHWSLQNKDAYGGVTRMLSFKKSSTELTVSYTVLQNASITPTSVIEADMNHHAAGMGWQSIWQKDLSHHTSLGDNRWGLIGKINATSIFSGCNFSRSNIIVFIGCSDSSFDLKALATEIDSAINALPDINSSNIGNHKPSLTLTPDTTTISVGSRAKITATTTDPNSHAVTIHHNHLTQRGLHLTKETYGYSALANMKAGTYTVVIVAINEKGLHTEKEVTLTVT